MGLNVNKIEVDEGGCILCPKGASKTTFVDGTRSDEYTEDGSRTTPFKTIQAAIDASTGLTVLLIEPETYNEDITLKPGVYLKSRMGIQPGVLITGKVSWPSGAGTILLSGIYVLNDSDHAIDFSGDALQKLRCHNSKFETNSIGAHHGINHSNTNPDSEMFLSDSLVQARDTSGGAKAIQTAGTSQGSIGLDNTTVRVIDDIDSVAVDLNGAIKYWHRMDEIRGRVIVATTATCNISLDGMYTNTVSVLETNSAGLTVLSSVIISTTASPAVTGAGAFAFSSVGYASTGMGFAATLNGGGGAAIGAIPGESADGIIYDNSISGLTADRVKTALDELATSGKKLFSFPMSAGGSWARNQTGFMCYLGFYVSELLARIVVPAGKVTKMAIRVSSNSISDPDTVVITLMKNGVATDMVITIPGDTTGLFTTTDNPVTFADIGELSWRVAIGTGTGVDGITFKAGTIEMEV